MKLVLISKLKLLFFLWFISLFFWFLSAQYYKFDTGVVGHSTYPYQQWCQEKLSVRADPSPDWSTAWAFEFYLDPTKISYVTGFSNLDGSNFFERSSQVFFNKVGVGFAWDFDYTRFTVALDNGQTLTFDDWLYWNIIFTPLYSTNISNWSFLIDFAQEYNWCSSNATVETTLSKGWCDIIDVDQQKLFLTWTYDFLQEPCVADNNAPSISNILPPHSSDKQTRLSWISLSLNEAVWVSNISNVPYVWTWWHTLWTWNPWWTISNQYWINPDTFSLTISWNSEFRLFTWWSLGVTLVWNQRTWEDNYKNYSVIIDQAQLFNYWIEKTITIKADVDDRKWLSSSQVTSTFNVPVWPRALWAFSPLASAIFVNLSAPINLWIQDNWAWVDSGSIKVTLEWINWTTYWPYIFTGSDLNLSWVSSSANQPNYYISVTNHIDFPTSWTIRVRVDAEDMENNPDTILDYTFTTRPSCSELQCCDDIYTQIWNWTSTIYSYADLYVNFASWFIPTFDNQWATWYLDCRESSYWIAIFSWDGDTWTFLDQFSWTELVFSGTNIKAILTWDSWNVILLVRIWNFIIKVFPGNRIRESMSTIWSIYFLDQNKNFIYSWSITTSSSWNSSFIDGMMNIQPWVYYVAYASQSHLASYISWVVVEQNSWLIYLDFTTWINLTWTELCWYVWYDWYSCQVAWNIINSQWISDWEVNWSDISIITEFWLADGWITLLDKRNLNWDSALNSLDIGIVWANFLKYDGFQPEKWFFSN